MKEENLGANMKQTQEEFNGNTLVLGENEYPLIKNTRWIIEKESITTVVYTIKEPRKRKETRVFINYLNVDLGDFASSGDINKVTLLRGNVRKELNDITNVIIK